MRGLCREAGSRRAHWPREVRLRAASQKVPYVHFRERSGNAGDGRAAPRQLRTFGHSQEADVISLDSR